LGGAVDRAVTVDGEQVQTAGRIFEAKDGEFEEFAA
jgi:hypothetical protein